ncbi:hypothetical protein OsI_17327 [Oryza sativa Indica Group]|uniref:Uncharacterized protein n=1 Tax=Oryza sativa subsp. indica TaxID=39946 RepID=B8ATW1_ORYSI|nr:hypothetical protein OsI_17327 [Oryza sativa Indica Group]
MVAGRGHGSEGTLSAHSARAWRREHNSDEQDDSDDDGAGRPRWGGSKPGAVARRNVRSGGHRAHRGGGGGARKRCRPGGHRAPAPAANFPSLHEAAAGAAGGKSKRKKRAVSRRTCSGRGPVLEEEEELQSPLRIMARSTLERSRPVCRRALRRASYCSLSTAATAHLAVDATAAALLTAHDTE